MDATMILDAHTHAWGAPSPQHPWVNASLVEDVEEFSVGVVYSAEDLLADMDEAGVDEAVVVGYPLPEWTDNWYTLAVAGAYERLHGVVMADPFADEAAERVRQDAAAEGIAGVRLGVLCPYDRMWESFDPSADWLRDAVDREEFWAALAETDTAVQILAHVDQLDQVTELVERYPDLTYLLDHFAYADPETPPAEAYSALSPLAEYDSVVVKVSEAAHRSAEPYPYADLHDHVRWLVDSLGRDRVAWGSDFPNVSDVATYADSVTWLDRVEGLSDADRRWLCERTFRRRVL